MDEIRAELEKSEEDLEETRAKLKESQDDHEKAKNVLKELYTSLSTLAQKLVLTLFNNEFVLKFDPV